MAAKPYRPRMTAAEKKAYKKREFGVQGKTGGMGGKYGRKSENLSAAQLKRAGATKAAAKRTVDISQTRREGAVTLGPGGKPLTGTVKLANGKTAVYKGGKRVQAGPAVGVRSSKPKPTTSTGRGGGGRTAVDRAKGRMGKAAGYGKGAGTPSNLTGLAASKPGGPKKPASTSMARPGQKPPGAAAATAARNNKPKPKPLPRDKWKGKSNYGPIKPPPKGPLPRDRWRGAK